MPRLSLAKLERHLYSAAENLLAMGVDGLICNDLLVTGNPKPRYAGCLIL
jgi:hypothetical protein